MKSKIYIISILLMVFSACDLFKPNVDTPVDVEIGTMSDIDSNVYKTVKIGNQWWMAENLKVTHYRHGAAIPKITDNTEWSLLETAAWCNYENNDDYKDSLGCLYNWYAINDTAQLAPEGWHIAGDEDWKELEIYIGMDAAEADNDYLRGTDEGYKLKSATSWESGGSDIYSFSLVATGYRRTWGVFMSIGYSSPLWTATECDSTNAWDRSTTNSSTGIARIPADKRTGFCVRCVKDTL